MKVYIGKYKNWFGPYQLAEKLMFWVPQEKDEWGFYHTADKVHKFGEWLAHGSIEPEAEVGSIRSWDRERPMTFVYKFLLWIDKLKDKIPRQYIKIDRWDTWSMDSTLSPIILPMLKKLKVEKHGYPTNLDYEDLPEHLRLTDCRGDDYQQMTLFDNIPTHQDGESLGEVQWNWIMDEMIFAFDHLVDQSWEEKYHTGVIDFKWKKLEDGCSQMLHGENHTHVCDYDGLNAEWERVNNGLRLFGKYYRSLWD
jgi:hypothetical protein